ncbi:MAG TPA: hypothetical protein VN726_01600 [Hanamia sp.]|nr:hypothetical protein [Hanamia sp.]
MNKYLLTSPRGMATFSNKSDYIRCIGRGREDASLGLKKVLKEA